MSAAWLPRRAPYFRLRAAVTWPLDPQAQVVRLGAHSKGRGAGAMPPTPDQVCSPEADIDTAARPPVFAHPSERELARIFDFFRVPWRYEPDSFVLKAKGERVLEMFSPDFYLPELDLYLELTTLRQRLVTKKNRKLRLLRELYPDVNVRLLYRKDYQELLAKYGFGPEEVASPEVEAFRAEADRAVLFSQAEIAAAVRPPGGERSPTTTVRPPILVGVLKGVSFFLSDLIRQIRSAGRDRLHGGLGAWPGPALRIVKDLDIDIQGREVILVEDIVDTGMTLRYILGHLERGTAVGGLRAVRQADAPPGGRADGTSGSSLPTSSWLATGWIITSGTATCRSSPVVRPEEAAPTPAGPRQQPRYRSISQLRAAPLELSGPCATGWRSASRVEVGWCSLSVQAPAPLTSRVVATGRPD